MAAMSGLYIISKIPRETSYKAKLENGIPALKQKLKLICGDDPVTENYFINVLPSKNPEFPKKFFLFLSRGEPVIDQDSLVKRIVNLARDDDNVKLRVLFDIYDFNGDGALSFEEVCLMLRACMAENGLQFTDDEIDQLTRTFIEEADMDNSCTVDFEEFKAVLDRYEALVECMCRSFERWMLLCPAKLTTNNSKKVSFWQAEYIRNNPQNVIALTLYVALSVGLFFGSVGFYAAQKASPSILIARGAGILLNFNSSLIMVFILRRCITKLRIWGLNSLLPLDNYIKYHKYVGFMITFYALIHTLAHLINYAFLLHETGPSYLQLITRSHPDKFRFFYGAANITGWVCLIALLIILISSLPFVRKNGHFEIFAYCHLFYIVFWTALLLHGPRFWMWFIVPGVFFLFERSYYLFGMMGVTYGHTYVVRARALPSGVSHLAIRRPKNFTYLPGDFVYIQISTIASWEWHPFTISSAPEMPDIIFLHIRSTGQWTDRLYSILLQQQEAALEVLDDISLNKYNEMSISIPPPPPPPPPKVFSPLASISSNEISETPFIKRRTRRHPVSSIKKVADPVEKNRQIVQELNDRLGTIMGENESNLYHVIEFTRPIGSWLDDDDESQFYPVKEKVHIQTSQMISSERIVSSTPKSNKSFRSKSSIKSLSDVSKKQYSGRIIRSPLELPIRIDGPYGSPASAIFSAEHAVLVATGIGVTPFASILQSIMFRYAKSRHTCPKCYHSWSDVIPADVMRLKKVDFIWLNRDQKSLEWFVHLLSQLEMTQVQIDSKDRFLDIHIFITSALDGADIRAIGLQLALGLMHVKKERDLISGLRTRTKPGRPSWPTIFTDITKNQKGKVSLFFCGNHSLGKELHFFCNKYGFSFYKETY